MATYIVTNKATSLEIYRYNANEPIEWSGMEYSTHLHTEYVEDIGEPVVTPRKEWTPVEFLRRFTAPERIAARAARKTDPVLDDFYALLEQAPAIANDDPDVQMGLGYMTQQGYLAAGRAAEILNG